VTTKNDGAMTKRTIHIDFCDFYPRFNKTDNFFYNLLKERYELILSDQPDFLIFSSHGHEHRVHSGVKIFVSGESGAPDFRECDYSLTCRKVDDPRHLQLPYYVRYGKGESIVKRNDDPARILAGKTKFCSFVVRNHNPRKNRNRLEFFQRLSQYKQVDSGGAFMNNIGGPILGFSAEKVEFLRAYKFNIAFENRSLPGYTTEKIFEPMVARCLPIYWGNPLITEEFNPKSFLNYADFPNEEALIEKIIDLDGDDAKYLECLRQPYFYNDEPNIYFSRERMLDFFEKIFAAPAGPRKTGGGISFGRWIFVKKHHPRRVS
jgi:alpha(1,3/1,4) fucosyltransferase